jgi:hypothetical protein
MGEERGGPACTGGRQRGRTGSLARVGTRTGQQAMRKGSGSKGMGRCVRMQLRRRATNEQTVVHEATASADVWRQRMARRGTAQWKAHESLMLTSPLRMPPSFPPASRLRPTRTNGRTTQPTKGRAGQEREEGGKEQWGKGQRSAQPVHSAILPRDAHATLFLSCVCLPFPFPFLSSPFSLPLLGGPPKKRAASVRQSQAHACCLPRPGAQQHAGKHANSIESHS